MSNNLPQYLEIMLNIYSKHKKTVQNKNAGTTKRTRKM